MPIVEFAGPSGVGKTTFLNLLLQHEKLKRWRKVKDFEATPPEEREQLKGDLLNTYKKMWDRKCDLASRNDLPQDMKESQLGYAYWHLHRDQSLVPESTNLLGLIDENILQHYLPELIWLTKHHADEAKTFLADRNFILLIDDPQTILTRFRQRQFEGIDRPFTEASDDATILSNSKDYMAWALAFLRGNQDFGYNWFVIDLSKGLDRALLKATAFVSGLENIHDHENNDH